jgi:UDP:flavonoid glycosyltransferase YjiC (YdhE family)
MIVMPIFFDQYDTAQRIEEKGFGVRLDPYVCEENELLECIERTLNDKTLALKLEKMSKRIQSSKNLLKITELIENLIKK